MSPRLHVAVRGGLFHRISVTFLRNRTCSAPHCVLLLTSKPQTPSHEEDSRETSRQQTRSSGGGHHSPLLGTKGHDVQSPPLTPAGTEAAEADARVLGQRDAGGRRSPRHDIITPQESTQDISPPPSAQRLVHRPASSESAPGRPASSEGKEHSTVVDAGWRCE